MSSYIGKFLAAGGAIAVVVCIVAGIVITLSTEWFAEIRRRSKQNEDDPDRQS